MSEFPNGRRAATVVSHALAMTATGKEQIAICFEDDETKATLTWYGYFTDAGYPITERALIALGWDPIDNDLDVTKLNGTEELVGRKAVVVVQDEEYNGFVRPKIAFVNDANGGLAIKEQMDDQAAKSFSEQLRKRVLASRGPQASTSPGRAAPARSAPPRKAVPAQQEEDFGDIPF